ncbi:MULTISPECIES: carbon-nitrogen hydrolase family protein [unclassified Microbacterium]|uniref:carbon-nitrogen hydrolase family protein n=1 Tax=unclassified Microbacterium TaxID=2609290 RepID=UPI00365A3372
MARTLTIAAVQAGPIPIGASLDAFAAEVKGHGASGIDLVVYPELHLFGTERWPEAENEQRLRAASVPLDGAFVDDLRAIAHDAGVALIPGSVCERGRNGELYNTSLAIAADGALTASYRKIFPWRPYEPYDPGDRFVTYGTDAGVVGLSICYDAWFPEVTRHLAWMGADVVVNIVKTTTPDRAQELVLARANSIVNQTFTVSVNCAGPVGKGQSIVVDPEGAVLAEAGVDPEVLRVALDLDHVDRVRTHGTAGSNRMWAQFLPADAALELPLYEGRIEPHRWEPRRPSTA